MSEERPRDGVHRLPPADDSLWDEVAAGELDADELAVLRALAEGDDEQARVAAFEPIDVGRREAIASKLVTDVRRARRRRVIGWSVAGLAAAAAIALVIWLPRGEPLPSYAMVVSSGAATSRELPDERARDEARVFGPGTRFELVLTPTREVEDAVVFSTFAEIDGELVPWRVEVQRSVSGAARIVGPAGEVLPRGVRAVVIVIGREVVSLEDARRMRADDPRVLRARVERAP